MLLVVIECCLLWLTIVGCIDHQSNIVVSYLCLSVVGDIDYLLLVVLMINPTLLLVVVDLFCLLML
jgi:hypothetical protein